MINIKQTAKEIWHDLVWMIPILILYEMAVFLSIYLYLYIQSVWNLPLWCLFLIAPSSYILIKLLLCVFRYIRDTWFMVSDQKENIKQSVKKTAICFCIGNFSCICGILLSFFVLSHGPFVSFAVLLVAGLISLLIMVVPHIQLRRIVKHEVIKR